MATYASIAYDQALANPSAMVLLKTIEASSDATISFVDGSDGVTFDSTYKEYIFRYITVHPSHEYYSLAFNASDDASSHSYDITKTTTFFNCIHQEDDSPTALNYNGNHDSKNYYHLNSVSFFNFHNKYFAANKQLIITAHKTVPHAINSCFLVIKWYR